MDFLVISGCDTSLYHSQGGATLLSLEIENLVFVYQLSVNRNCYRLSRVSWALAQISCYNWYRVNGNGWNALGLSLQLRVNTAVQMTAMDYNESTLVPKKQHISSFKTFFLSDELRTISVALHVQ